MKPLPKKVQALVSLPAPQKQKDLLAFLGAANFWRRSLGGLNKNGKYFNTAALLQGLYNIATEKGLNAKKFVKKWSEDPQYEQAYQDAKQLLIQAANLVHLNPNAPLALFVDASDQSLGGTLCQRSNNGWSAIGYYSKSLNEAQKKYSIFRKEMLSLHHSIRHFLPEIIGRDLHCFTDNRSLVDAFKNPEIKLNDPIAARQLIEISQFTTKVSHISGAENVGADFLSRFTIAKVNPPSTDVIYQPFTPLMTEENENQAQSKSNNTTKIHTTVGIGNIELASITETANVQTIDLKKLQEAQETCSETLAAKSKNHAKNASFAVIDIDNHKILCEISNRKPRPLIPKSMRYDLIHTLHSIGHPGLQETKLRVNSQYYWNKSTVI